MSGLWYFWGSLALLLGGYFVYGAFVEKVFGADFGRLTPVKSQRDGVDDELPRYKIFLIQLLNIAGLGPVISPSRGAVRAFRPALGRVRLHFQRRGA
ncbi:MAG: carbon starvation CstA family protein [Bilophila wadsworthia]